MKTQNQEDNMSNLVWQSQPLEAPRISLEYVRHQAEKLNADFRRENYLIRVAAVICAVVFVLLIIVKPSVSSPNFFVAVVARLGPFLLLVGAIYTAFEVRRRGRFLSNREDDSVTQSLDTYHIELRRRRDYYLKAWRWSVWPTVPGVLVMLIGGMLYDQRPHKLIRYGLLSAWCVVGTLVGSLYYRHKGRKYQRELDALATLHGNQAN